MRVTTRFSYRAQTVDGTPLSGTIEALDANAARWQLQGLGLRLVELEPLAAEADKPAPLRGEDFAAFNQQLASLTAAGLPLEQGLRLIARDMRSGRLAATVRLVADELDKGAPLADVFARHAGGFPPLYAQVVEAGVRTGRLGAVLLNLGRHTDLMARLREAVWRSVAYPLMVLVGALAVMVFVAVFVLPPMRAAVEDLRSLGAAAADRTYAEDGALPLLSRLAFTITEFMPWVLAGVLVLIPVAMMIWWLAGRTASGASARERVLLATPLVGPVVRRSLVARWCDAVTIGLGAGMDLPAAVRLAADAVGSAALAEDVRGLVVAHETAQPMQSVGRLAVLPPAVLLAIDLGVSRSDLPRTVETLREMYRQQTDHALAILRSTLRPVLIAMLGLLLGLMIAGLFLPLLAVLRGLT